MGSSLFLDQVEKVVDLSNGEELHRTDGAALFCFEEVRYIVEHIFKI